MNVGELSAFSSGSEATATLTRDNMATKAWVAKQKRREALVKKYRRHSPAAEEGKELRGAGEAAARFEPDALATTAVSSPAAAAACCGSSRSSRIMLRELALAGKIPGLKKASW